MAIFNERYEGFNMQSPTDITHMWIVNTIGESRVCPPLVKYLQENRTPDGSLNWPVIRQGIQINDYSGYSPTDSQAVSDVAGSVYSFMQTAHTPEAPITTVQILPDFRTNEEYDAFMLAVRQSLIFHLLEPSERSTFMMMAEKAGQAGIVDFRVVSKLMKGTFEEQFAAVAPMVTDMFRPVYFYGRDLSDNDTRGFGGSPDPSPRQKVLSRAPFYLMQIVNSYKSGPYTQGMDREGLRKRNTKFAKSLVLKDLRRQMNDYRKKRPQR